MEEVLLVVAGWISALPTYWGIRKLNRMRKQPFHPGDERANPGVQAYQEYKNNPPKVGGFGGYRG